MKKLIKLLILIVIILAVIKYVKPVNEWASENLPAGFMEFIGEEPRNMIPKDLINDVLDGADDAVDKLKDMVNE